LIENDQIRQVLYKDMWHLSRTKTFKHFSYDDLQFFFLSQDSWQKIIMNFITNFSFNRRSNDVYDFVLVIINRYIKMTFYIFVTKKIIAIELTKIIFNQMMLKYDASKDVVSNREFVFTKRILNRHLLSHENEKTIKHRLSFADRWSNRTSKSKFEALFTNVLLRKADRMSKILTFDWVRLLKQRTIHHWMQSFFLHVRL
jgi:hypothetical protein